MLSLQWHELKSNSKSRLVWQPHIHLGHLEGKTVKMHIILLENWTSIRGFWNHREVEQWSCFLNSFNMYILLWEVSIFPRLILSAAFFSSDVPGVSSPLDVARQVLLTACRSISGYQNHRLLNFANQNPTFTFPFYVTCSMSLIDTWKISCIPLTQGNTGNLGLWNASAALNALGFFAAGLVCGPEWCKLCVAQNSQISCWGSIRSVFRLQSHFWGLEDGVGRLWPVPHCEAVEVTVVCEDSGH